MTQKEIKLGDTFLADGLIWTVTDIDESEGICIEHQADSRMIYLINVSPLDTAVFVYRKFKNGNTRGIQWSFSFDELRMINEIIDLINQGSMWKLVK
jgi:hypothetical protein